MINPLRSEEEAFRFVIGALAYFGAIGGAAAIDKWAGLIVFIVLTAAALLAGSGIPSREKIREHLSGNYCRCTGYHAIVDAVEAVAQARAGKRP